MTSFLAVSRMVLWAALFQLGAASFLNYNVGPVRYVFDSMRGSHLKIGVQTWWKKIYISRPVSCLDCQKHPERDSENSRVQTYFTKAQDVPMDLYNTFVCAVYKKAPRENHVTLVYESPEKTWALLSLILGTLDIDLLYRASRGRYERYKYFALRQIKALLIGNMAEHTKTAFKRALLTLLNWKDIERVFEHIYLRNERLGREAEKQLSIFYAGSPSSTARFLSNTDRKRLLTDLVLVANKRIPCFQCSVRFHDVSEVVDAMVEQLLPGHLKNEMKRAKAADAIKYIAHAKLTSKKVSELLWNLAKMHKMNKDVKRSTCQVLNYAKSTSYYCGVRESALQLFKSLECDRILKKHEHGAKRPEIPNEDGPNANTGNEDTTSSYSSSSDSSMAASSEKGYHGNGQDPSDDGDGGELYPSDGPSEGINPDNGIDSGPEYENDPSPKAPPKPTTPATRQTTTRKLVLHTTAAEETTRAQLTTTQRLTTSVAAEETTRTAILTTTKPTTTKAPLTTTQLLTTPEAAEETTRASILTTAKPTTTKAPLTTTQGLTTPVTTTTTTSTSTTPKSVLCGVSDTASRMTEVQDGGLLLEARIVGGFVAGTCSTYPWMVRILIQSTGNTCGGAILDDRHILTAAHCLLFTDSIRVFIGDYDRSAVEGTEQIFDVSINEKNNTAVHPQYDYGNKQNDIAVVTLDQPINLEEICATPLCLDEHFRIRHGQKCTTAGWGLTGENERYGSNLMRAVSMPTFTSKECLTLFPDLYMSDPEHQVCAGQPDVGGVDSCGGDSGSPLFCMDDTSGRWVALGVVSYGEGCARAGYAGIYTDVRKFIPWIRSRLRSS